jgi:hypothetical protein
MKDLPQELRDLKDAPPGDRRYHEDFESLRTEISKLIATFEISLIEDTQTKVILYFINYAETHKGTELAFEWLVAQKVVSGGDRHGSKAHFYKEHVARGYGAGITRTEVGYSDIDHNRLEMSWTKEREAWFEQMDRALRDLGQRLTAGFGAVPEVLARKIDQGHRFMLAGGES